MGTEVQWEKKFNGSRKFNGSADQWEQADEVQSRGRKQGNAASTAEIFESPCCCFVRITAMCPGDSNGIVQSGTFHAFGSNKGS